VGAHETSKCKEVCPVDCCVPDDAHKETKQQSLAKWQAIHPGEKPAPGTF
jgi:hypothetical protein